MTLIKKNDDDEQLPSKQIEDELTRMFGGAR
jgi:hypothetical protein